MKCKSILVVLFAALAAATALWAMPATAGQIYVVNPDSGTIGKYSTSGATINASLITGLSTPYGIAVVPEPSTIALLSSALMLIGGMRFLRSRRRAAALRFWMIVAIWLLALPVSGRAAILFVSDQGSGNIYEFTPTGSRSTFASGVSNAYGLAFDPSGNLFQADNDGGGLGSGIIYKFTPTGSRSTFASGLQNPIGLACDASGNLFEADLGSENIYRFTPAGSRSTFTSGLFNPYGLAFDGNGNLFEADLGSDKIYKFTPAGSRSTFASGVGTPFGLAFDTSGNLFASTLFSGIIYKFTPTGSRSTFASGLNEVTGLACDGSGNLFAADFSTGNIYKFTPAGSRSTFASGLDNPVFLAFAPVPEPATVVLLASALMLIGGLRFLRWRRGRA